MIVVKAFTKLYAIPGVRLGFLFCGSQNKAGQIFNQLPEWTISIIAEAAGLAEGRLYLLQLTEASAEVTRDKVTVRYAGRTPLLGGLETREQDSAQRHNPVRALRKSRIIKELAE